jgi:hypothetical protein
MFLQLQDWPRGLVEVAQPAQAVISTAILLSTIVVQETKN